MTKDIVVPGLPEGVVVVRYGFPALPEYFIDSKSRVNNAPYYSGDSKDRYLVVVPARGYSFVYNRILCIYEVIKHNGFGYPVCKTFVFVCENQEQEQVLDSFVEYHGIKNLRADNKATF